ncbi:MAG: TonB-dependent receptor [Congregibacter sp.]|nr:TonB-dependent receptor [Congregibacter sp.]
MKSTRSSSPTLLALAVALASPVYAQEQDKKIEEVVVTASPIRDSQAAALEIKRLSDNVMDVISADTIGRFPDQNLADSLGRVPGVAIERDQGQARYVNLRGAPFRWTGIAFDGIDVPGAENGRIPRFDSFPSTITSRIEVNKAILPSMPGESVSGYINVHTFNPFDVAGPSFAFDYGMGQQDLGDGDVDRLGLRGSFSNENFGVVAFVSENSREQITDNREYDLARSDSGEIIVNELDFRSYKIKREDSAYGGRVEYRGEGAVSSVFASTLYSEFVDEEERTQWVFEVGDPQAGAVRENVPLAINRLLQFGTYENSTSTSTLGTDLAAGAWDVQLRVNYTETEFAVRLPIPQSFGGGVGSFDVTDLEDPIVTLPQALDDVFIGATFGIDVANQLDIQATKFKLDAQRDSDLFGDSTLAFGLQYDQRESQGFAVGFGFGPFPGNIDINSFSTDERWYSNTTNSINGTYYNNKGLRSAWEAEGGVGDFAVPEDLRVQIDEDIIAAYAMATTRFGWGDIVYGLRIESTDYISAGNVEGERLVVDDDFINVLPSVHVNVDLTDDLKLRTSLSSGVNRPTYNEWRAAASLNVSDREVSGGNPFLEAEETFGGDVALEWYFADASILSAGVFYRYVDNVIYVERTEIDGGDYLPGAEGQVWQFDGAVNGDDGYLAGLELNFIGMATDLLPGALSGFGVSANLTVLDSEFTGVNGETFGLPGTSDLIYNASLFYENYGFSARINYQYRDQWISPIEDPSEFWGEQERVDLTLLYTLPFDLGGATTSLYFNANNLTDETDVRFAGNGTINQSESYGAHYLLGLRVNY